MDELSLVTGGAGFIGSHLVDALVKAGRPVRVFDDFSTGLRSNLAHHAGRVEVVEGSLTDPAAVARAVQGAGAVYHLGALASVARSVETPAVSHAACATGTLNLLDAARRAGVRRVVYAASSSAYGGSTGDGGQREDQAVAAKSPYAAAKLAGELYCQAFAHTYGLETVRLRFFNIFGPRQRSDSPYSGVIALFTAAMSRGEAPTVHGDGNQSRDFTFVANAVQALMKAAEAPEASGNVYNVGTGRTVSVRELIAALNRLLGKDLEPTYGAPRAGDVKFSRADISRTRSDLGYDPAVSFEDGLRQTVNAFTSANPKPARVVS
ncbi:NAD-dependent epimerase/dehydratase family protein [Urbifossiella limnaea]|uniref:UDP-glucose 4-epimerase n=1 Tax=Urbifossiella limnaea TaxID=2528023 RepID=A0A517XXA8_9BACT|nr:NAD-dependent epimerase/dehydratase family protein [Urbifossiella limnaea]QDU22114.1 UDP-glucose 4-epimerase [Urbifossiella limnaea]